MDSSSQQEGGELTQAGALGKRLDKQPFPKRTDVAVFSAPFSLAGACCNPDTLFSRQKAIQAETPCSHRPARQARPSHSPILQMLRQINQGQRTCLVIKNQEQDWRSGKSRRPGASLSSCFPHRRPASSGAFQRNLCLV